MLSASYQSLRKHGLSADQAKRIASATIPEAWRSWLHEPGNALIVFEDDLYPARLREAIDAPLALWARGPALGLLANPQLAIVGSRHPTHNGRIAAESFAAEISRAGMTIVSGLALGIDAASHCGALDHIGSTIAVLGNGIDRIYPRGNYKLAAQILKLGLIVSEYGPGVPVRALQFPRRNRIIAALSLGTLVVEATRRSGSLITARLALEYSREVFAMPGSIHNTQSKGCHKLLRAGAKLVEEVDDILVELAPQLRDFVAAAKPKHACADRSDLPAELADCLDYSPISFDALASASGLTAAELSSMLLHLELQGKIEALPGGRYCRLAKRAR